LAQAHAQAGFNIGGVSVQSTVELLGGGSTEATAQGGSGQSPVNPGFIAFATALPNAAYATTLIGSANNVADALLGPDDKIFGTAILEGGGSSTFDFGFRGDLILGDISDNSVTNLGFMGPNIDLTIEDDGVFVLGGAVPEPSTWAMMLIGFAGLGFLGWRGSRKTAAHSA
jgi:PEP-CTERM motif